jgi:hypothetical protein
MAEKGFGAKKISLTGVSGTPKISSVNNLNINAVQVSISTDVSIGGTVQSNLNVGTGYSLAVLSVECLLPESFLVMVLP